MTSEESASFLKLLDLLIPWFRPCYILNSTIDASRFPSRRELENALSGWLCEEAVEMVDGILESNSTAGSLLFNQSWPSAEWVSHIPTAVDPTQTVLAFARPALSKESRLALTLYYSSGPRAMFPIWSIAALARKSHAEDWEMIVQCGTIIGELT